MAFLLCNEEMVSRMLNVSLRNNGRRRSRLTRSVAFLNIVDNLMNIYYVYLAHFAQSPYAPLLGFASAIMTLSKTALYWLQEYYCGGECWYDSFANRFLTFYTPFRLRCRSQRHEDAFVALGCS